MSQRWLNASAAGHAFVHDLARQAVYDAISRIAAAIFTPERRTPIGRTNLRTSAPARIILTGRR